TAPARNTAGYLALLHTLDQALPQGDLDLVTDHLSSHNSGPIRDWLLAHPRIQQAFIPVGAAWLNLIEGWWRLFRRKAFAGQSLADHQDIASVTALATAQLNRQATPCYSVDLGPPTSAAPYAPALFCLSPLRNDATRR